MPKFKEDLCEPTIKTDCQKSSDELQKYLVELSLKGLSKMFDDEKQLFHFKVSLSNGKLIKEGHSLRYTIISLLGLHKYEKHASQSPVNIQKVLSYLIDNVRSIDNLGDLGLLLWLCAMVSPKKLKDIYSSLDLDNILITYQDAREIRTMELSWFLTGLSYSVIHSEKNQESLKDLALKTYNLVITNYRDKGIFGHQIRGSIFGRIRGRIGSFADQVYPIYALSKFSKAFGNDEALKIALKCAETICHHQGSLGQWWWHYNALTGNVIRRYPVYSVHQNGMAPMALLAVSDVSGINFDDYIYKGLKWITGKNEININLVDNSLNVIWRCLYQNKYKMLCEEASSLLLSSRFQNQNSKDVHMLYESRPYHLGWLLYAFTDTHLA